MLHPPGAVCLLLPLVFPPFSTFCANEASRNVCRLNFSCELWSELLLNKNNNKKKTTQRLPNKKLVRPHLQRTRPNILTRLYICCLVPEHLCSSSWSLQGQSWALDHWSVFVGSDCGGRVRPTEAQQLIVSAASLQAGTQITLSPARGSFHQTRSSVNVKMKTS